MSHSLKPDFIHFLFLLLLCLCGAASMALQDTIRCKQTVKRLLLQIFWTPSVEAALAYPPPLAPKVFLLTKYRTKSVLIFPLGDKDKRCMSLSARKYVSNHHH